MIKLYDELATRAIESTAIEKSVASARDLMHRASRTAFIKLKEIWPKARRVSVLCGKGNNGGDGYYMALIAARAGLDVEIVFCGDGNTKGRETGVCLEEVSKAGVTVKKKGENMLFLLITSALASEPQFKKVTTVDFVEVDVKAKVVKPSLKLVVEVKRPVFKPLMPQPQKNKKNNSGS